MCTLHPWDIYFAAGSLYLLITFTYFVRSLNLLPSGNHQFVFCIYESVCFVLFCFV